MTLILLFIMISTPSFASLAIKPGLWTIETKMKRDGKEFDPQAHMKTAMANMTPEKKKQMEAYMKTMREKHGQTGPSAFGMSNKGMQVCYSGESIKNDSFLNQHHAKECETTFPVKTSTHIVTEFKCKSGATGKAEWNVKDSTHYQGNVTMNSKEGKKSEINYLGTFTSSDCGGIKPIEEVMSKKK